MRWRRWLLVTLAVLVVPVAIALAIAAVDVIRVSDAVARDDVRFQARPTLPSGLWEGTGLLPGGIARRAVGLDETLRYRRAVWLFARVQPGKVYINTPDLDALRASAETKLIDASRAETDGRRRAQLLNMLALITLDRYAGDPADRINIIRSAIGTLQAAIKADPDNADAKFNLELVLRNFAAEQAPGSQPDRGPNRGRLSGLGRSGSGY
jgi:hypothetical protein